MSLKSKTLLILLVFMALYMAIHGAITRLIILPGFFNLEKTEAEKNIWRPTRALNRELYHLTLLVQDWAVWDDTYNFMATGSKDYIESNLGNETFSMDHLNLFCLCDTQGKIFWQKTFDLETKKAIEIPELPDKAYPAGHPLITFGSGDGSSKNDQVSGIIPTSMGPMMVASRHVFTSARKGPSRGTLIMGRLLTGKTVSDIIEQTEVSFEVQPIKVSDPVVTDPNIQSIIRGETERYIDKSDPHDLFMFTVLKDIGGKPVYILKSKMERSILREGYLTLRYIIVSLIVTGFLLGGIMMILLHGAILDPLSVLIGHAKSIEASGDLTQRLDFKRTDEIGVLAGSFDRMLQKLTEVRDELLDQSYHSGLAGMTSDILHNAGNIMMPMSHKMSRLLSLCHQMPIKNILKAAEELDGGKCERDREDKLKRYLYLSIQEMGGMVGDSETVLSDMTMDIHDMERLLGDLGRYSHAGKAPRDIIPETIVHMAFSRLPVSLTGKCLLKIDPGMGDLPVLRAEPIVLGQVLSTLLHQAAEFAIQGKEGKAEVRVNARTERVMGEISIHFIVSDNGPEQDSNELSMLFGRDYSETNRKSVFSGFHWCSNVVSAMKGSLDIKSGPDGTDFHLILPVGGDA